MGRKHGIDTAAERRRQDQRHMDHQKRFAQRHGWTIGQVRQAMREGWLKIETRPAGKPTGNCGAHARSTGKPCRAPAMSNGRCKLHGGLSTGPRTPEGLESMREAVRERWAKWREERGLPPCETSR